MSSSLSAPVGAPLVWLPFDPELLGDPPSGLRYEVVDPTEHVPDSVADVAFYVTPYRLGTGVGDVLERMAGLRVVQTLTAGVDAVRSRVPEGVALCNGRGIHDASTAELALTLVLSSLRGVPDFVRAQDRSSWEPGWRPALADKRVLLVGYGSIGEAIEARLTPFEVDVVRVARSARDGVHPITDLPDLLPGADVVILIVPLTDETRGLVDADFLARMKDGGAAGERGPRGRGRDRRAGRRAAHRAGPGRAGRLRHRAAAGGEPALDGPGRADLPARGRREQRDVAAGAPAGAGPAAPFRRRGAPVQRHVRRLLIRP